MDNPTVPISWGELFDKISILEIKLEKISAVASRNNVKTEYDNLYSILNASPVSHLDGHLKYLTELKIVNMALWEIEDEIRIKESQQLFDDEFVQLARNVYLTNDERSRLKRKINQELGSELFEEKSYAAY